MAPPDPAPTRTRANGRPESKSALILLILVIEFHTGTFYSHSRTAGCHPESGMDR